MTLQNEIAEADKSTANFDAQIEELRKKAADTTKPVKDLGA
jgi:hypothetical protein